MGALYEGTRFPDDVVVYPLDTRKDPVIKGLTADMADETILCRFIQLCSLLNSTYGPCQSMAYQILF